MNEAPDHSWVRSQLATYLADGLSDEERARFESHLGTCGKCLEDLQEAQATERALQGILKWARPAPGMEDRLIRALRSAPSPVRKSRPTLVWIGQGVAAAILMGVLGYMISQYEENGGNLFAARSEAPRANVTMAPGAPPPGNAPADPARPSIDDMANLRAKEMLQRAQGTPSQEPDGTFFERGDADHNEAEEAAGYRGRPTGADDTFGGGGAAPRKGLEESKKSEDQIMSRMVDAQTPAPSLDAPRHFRPSEMQRGEKDMAKAPAPPSAKPAPTLADGKFKSTTPLPQDPPANRKIIRQGELEFEVDSFDNSLVQITKIAAEDGGYIATVNSDRLPNGKVRGTIVLRVPPDRLDLLVLKLRALGDLKSQRITSEDVTKKYTDVESRLKAARTMEARLIEIIKTGKGEIKDILLAEKELGEWREKIEVHEGEIRFMSNMVSMSTLSLTLYEKDIRQPSAVTETETVQMSLQSENVEKAYKDALAAITDAKGRVTLSKLNKHDGGQFAASITFEVAPDAAIALRDRLSQLGRVAFLDVSKSQSNEDGRGKAPGVQVKKNDSIFIVSIYNLANIQARETVNLSMATQDIEAVYKSILARIQKAEGRVINSQMNRQRSDQTSATVNFEIPAAQADAVQADVRAMGETIQLLVTENQDLQNVTTTKRGFYVTLVMLGAVPPRESTVAEVAARDAAESFRGLQKTLQDLKVRFTRAQLTEGDPDRVVGELHFDLLTKDLPAFEAALKIAGDQVNRNVQRTPDGQMALESKTHIRITVRNIVAYGPRMTHKLAMEVLDVDKSAAQLVAMAAELKGRVVGPNISRRQNGVVVGNITMDVPLGSTGPLLERIRALGTVRVADVTRNDKAPQGDLAFARLDVTIQNPESIIAQDDGFMVQIKKGLKTSFMAVTWSLNLVIVGLLFVGPWALVVWFIVRMVRKSKAKAEAASVPPPAAA